MNDSSSEITTGLLYSKEYLGLSFTNPKGI